MCVCLGVFLDVFSIDTTNTLHPRGSFVQGGSIDQGGALFKGELKASLYLPTCPKDRILAQDTSFLIRQRGRKIEYEQG